MAPLGILSGLASFVAYYLTNNKLYLYSSLLNFGIIAWTIILMKEDINALRAANSKNTFEIVKSFCFKHHFRLGFSLTAFILTLKNISLDK